MHFFFFIWLVALVGCQFPHKDLSTPDQKTTQEHVAPTPNPTPNLPVEPPPLPKVGVVLGPGGVLGAFGHLGVLQGLEQVQVPIQAIVGLEWGSLTAALYAMQGKTHFVQWQLQKLKPEHFSARSSFFRMQQRVHASQMNDFFAQVFGRARTNQLLLPFACPTFINKTWHVRVKQIGSLSSILKRCLSFPPHMQYEEDYMAAPQAYVEVQDHLRELGVELIIYVDVLGTLPLSSLGFLEKTTPEDFLTWRLMRASLQKAIWRSQIRVNVRESFWKRGWPARHHLIISGREAGQRFAKKLESQFQF